MVIGISIHAPHAGCDKAKIAFYEDLIDFNPRTPCGVRLEIDPSKRTSDKFQSTHPMRGATLQAVTP